MTDQPTTERDYTPEARKDDQRWDQQRSSQSESQPVSPLGSASSALAGTTSTTSPSGDPASSTLSPSMARAVAPSARASGAPDRSVGPLTTELTHTRPRLLDLFCCAGGAGMGYHRAGFEVVGVDIAEQPNYPFEFVQGDALAYLAEHGHEFDAIHASPPCQSFTAYRRKGHGVGDGYLDLIPDTRALLTGLGVPWVIENVAGAPLKDAVRYCGSSFGLDVRRHRFFESNVQLSAPACDHSWQTPRFKPATNRTNLRRTVEVGVWRIPLEVQQKAMGIDWTTLRELSEAVPPAYTQHIGDQLIRQIQEVAA